jgi:hypothetical protein
MRALAMHTTDGPIEALGAIGWTRLACAGGLALLIGYTGGDLAHFPLYQGEQGSFFQQPWATAAAGAVAGLACMLVAYVVTMPVIPRAERSLSPAAGAMAWAGLSLRGGTMASVLQAADGSRIYWLLLVGGIFAIHFRFVAEDAQPPQKESRKRLADADILKSIAVQAGVTLVMMLVLNQTYWKGQVLAGVCLASLVGAWVAYVATGCLWRQAWVVPIAVGMVGYMVNALTATGIDTANIDSIAPGLGMPLPLDFVAVGPIGVLLGEIGARHESEDESAGQ